MAISVVRVTFADGAKMYSSFCTILGAMNPIIVQLSPELERFMEGESGQRDEDPGTALYRIIDGDENWPDHLPDDVPFEQVTCTLLFPSHDMITWASQAQRVFRSGVMCGCLSSAGFTAAPKIHQGTTNAGVLG